MKIYNLHEGSIAIPETWEDQSINVFANVLDDANGTNFVVSRDKRVHGETKDEYFERQIAELEKTLEKFKIIERHKPKIKGEETNALEFSWKSEVGMMFQMVSYQFLEDKIVILTGTSKNFMPPQARQNFATIIESFGRNADEKS